MSLKTTSQRKLTGSRFNSTNTVVTITSGSILYLDAGDLSSYSGTGTTWTDLSGYGNNGTLTNGPTFDNTYKGSIVFDGTNDYVNCNNSSNLQITQGSISAWAKTTITTVNYYGILVKQSNYGLFVYGGNLATYDWGNGVLRNSGVSIADGQWKYLTMTFTTNTGTPSNNAIFYINGVAVSTFTIKWSTDAQSLIVGMGGSLGSPGQFFPGNVAIAQVYNRALTASEVLQNFNATRTRFGL